jgi:3-hydroxyacyl-[acyl-carrier-protein] dehydratase
MHIEHFQLIDSIVELDTVAQTVRAETTVPNASSIFEGHFPGHPLLPGVLLIESMAQASGWLLIALTRFERMPFLAAVHDAKLRHFVPPGEQLAVSAKLMHEGSGYSRTKAWVDVGTKRICDAEITFRLMPFPSDDFRQVMRRTAARIAFPSGAMAE